MIGLPSYLRTTSEFPAGLGCHGMLGSAEPVIAKDMKRNRSKRGKFYGSTRISERSGMMLGLEIRPIGSDHIAIPIE